MLNHILETKILENIRAGHITRLSLHFKKLKKSPILDFGCSTMTVPLFFGVKYVLYTYKIDLTMFTL